MFCMNYRMSCHPNGVAGRSDGRVYGTWDFKWPQGYRIKVAFQEWNGGAVDFDTVRFVPENASEKAVIGTARGYGRLTRIVECLASRWLSGSPNIRFEFDHEHRVATKVTARNCDNTYDVLVSLSPLPRFQPRMVLQIGGAEGAKPAKYFLPGSELGRYAQRVDYGVPTTYLGKRRYLRASLEDYFGSQEFQHWTIHEFGHVLGLVHEQQNPNIFPRIHLKPLDQVVAILRRSLGYPEPPHGASRTLVDGEEITKDEVEEELSQAWPALPGNPFCDFREYGPGVPIDDTSSVMFHLYWARLLKGGSEDAPPVYYSKPHERDLAALQQMYPGRKTASAGARPSRKRASRRTVSGSPARG